MKDRCALCNIWVFRRFTRVFRRFTRELRLGWPCALRIEPRTRLRRNETVAAVRPAIAASAAGTTTTVGWAAIPDEQAIQVALEQALELEGSILAVGASVREQSKQAYGHSLLDARLSLMAVCAVLLKAYDGKPGNTSQEISDRLTLIAAFVQGVPTTETMISEGQYVKAAAALKQDMEILVRIHETIAGAAKAGKTPQMKFLPAVGARPIYGELNKVAHPSNVELIQVLLAGGEPSPGAIGVAVTPAFSAGTAVALYELHVYLLREVTGELIRLFSEMYDESDEPVRLAMAFWVGTTQQLQEAGHLQQES